LEFEGVGGVQGWAAWLVFKELLALEIKGFPEVPVIYRYQLSSNIP
jgi:hypothetical protein